MRALPLLLLLALVSLGYLTNPARADAFVWTGLGAYNRWTDSQNWTSPTSTYYPGLFSSNDTAEFGVWYSQRYNLTLDNNLSLANISFTQPGYSLTVNSFPYFANGITATYETAPNLNNDGYIYFNGTTTVMNLTGGRGGFYSNGGVPSDLVVLGTGTYSGHLRTDSGIGTLSLTVGDGTHTASLTLTNSEGYTNYAGTTLVHANATLVAGAAGALSSSSPHQIDGTLTLSSGTNAIASLSGSGTVNLGANQLTVNGGSFGGTITGAGGTLVKSGTGPLLLTGTNAYTGLTTVNGGLLTVNGSIAGPATVQTMATLGGSGTIGGAVTVQSGGALSPGSSFGDTGQLTLKSDLTLSGGSALLMEFDGTGSGLYDQLDVQGLFAAGGTLQLTTDEGYTPALGDSFTLFNGTTPGFESGSFLISTNLGEGLAWDTSSLALTGVVTVVPEPSTWALLLTALFLLLGWAHRPKQRDLSTERSL